MARLVCGAILLAAALPALAARALEILEVIYGNGRQVCYATDEVAADCNDRSFCAVEASNHLCGDPARGDRKQLEIGYSCGDGIRSIQVWEGEVATAYCMDAPDRKPVAKPADPVIPGFERCRNRRDCRPRGSDRDRLWIAEAAYGAGDRFCNATPVFQRYCEGNSRCSVRVDNDLCGDPARGARKQVEIDYFCNGRRYAVDVPENRTAVLSCP